VAVKDDKSRELVFAQRIVTANRRELSRADVKSSQGLAAAGALAICLLTAVTNGTWSPSEISGDSHWIWWTGCAFWVLSVLTMMLGLMPMLNAWRSADGKISDLDTLTYFGDIRRLRKHGDIMHALALATRYPMDVTLRELHWTSDAVVRKYRLVRTGLALLTVSTILLAASVL